MSNSIFQSVIGQLREATDRVLGVIDTDGLGEANGHNWWRVLYPKLCFADCLHAVVEEEQMAELEEVLTVEEYESLLQQPKTWKIAFKWF